MSLIMNSATASIPSAVGTTQNTGNTAQANSNVQSTPAAAATFNQTLVQMLLGTLGGQAAPAQASTSGKSTAASLGQETSELPGAESAENQGMTMLEDLLQGIDHLDEAIASDPSMMAVLQGWLQQVQNLFAQMSPGADSQVDGGSDNEGQGLPLIAQHAETLRFAVQDGLQQLMSQLQMQQSGAGQNLPQIEQLLQNLSSLLPQSSKATVGNNLNSQDVVASILNGDEGALKDLANLITNKPAGIASPLADEQSSAVPVALVQPGKDQNNKLHNVNSNPSNALASVNSTEENASSEDVNKPADSSSIVTAGQLQIKDTAAQLVKPVQPQVPVERFAKEMSGFVVSKLEFVKQHGMTEATISLFPEHLGQVDVKITMQNGHLIAQFATEHAFAKDSLEQQMNQLRSALQSQGIQVEKLEVTQNQSLSSHMYHDGRQPGSGTGQQKQNGKQQRELSGEDAVAAADMTEEWNEWIREVRSKEENYGSSFVAKA